MAKDALIDSFGDLLRGRLTSLRGMREAARTGMRVDEGHRPSNRGERAAVTSQGYLAAGLNNRIDELEAALALLSQVDCGACTRVVAGALVEVEDGEGVRFRYLLLPGAQGDLLGNAGEQVTVLSPRSPMGRGLIGLEEGDVAEVLVGGRKLELEVLGVS